MDHRQAAGAGSGNAGRPARLAVYGIRRAEPHEPGQHGGYRPAASSPRHPRSTSRAPTNRRWNGWSTGLRTAHEPILLARKPLVGTVAASVTAHQADSLHIDACRTGHRQPHSYTVTRWKPGATSQPRGDTETHSPDPTQWP
jgi:hypothetical protein